MLAPRIFALALLRRRRAGACGRGGEEAPARLPLPERQHQVLLPVPPPARAVLRCQIGHAVYAKRLTRYCGSPPIGVDWGGFELTATHKGAVTCTGGVLYSPEKERPVFVNLPYGASFRRGVFTCVSRPSGVTCRSRSGHGLFVSRETLARLVKTRAAREWHGFECAGEDLNLHGLCGH